MSELLTAWWQYDFMRYALMAVLLIMPLFALLGTMVVNNGMAFFSDALGHSALTGVAVGLLCGLTDPSIAMVLFAVVFALLMNTIRRSRLSSTDTVIGVFSSCGIALGLAILSRQGGFSRYQSLLIGDILNISPSELSVLAVVLAVTVLLWLLCFNRFHAVSIHPTLARSKGLPVAFLDNLFVVVIAVVVMLSIRWVGVLLINALLILPAAAARNIARSVAQHALLSVLSSVFSGVAGLCVSVPLGCGVGAAVVLCAAVCYAASLLIGRALHVHLQA